MESLCHPPLSTESKLAKNAVALLKSGLETDMSFEVALGNFLNIFLFYARTIRLKLVLRLELLSFINSVIIDHPLSSTTVFLKKI